MLDLDWLPEPVPGPHTVTFLPSGRQSVVEHGYSVFEAGQRIGEEIPTECGGKGTCGRCRVRVHDDADGAHGADGADGAARPPTYAERRFIPPAELAAHVRLACRLRVERDLTVTVLHPS